MTGGAAEIETAERERADIPDKYKWDLTPLFGSAHEWQREKRRLAADVPALAAFEGRLGSSAGVLADALETWARLDKAFHRARVYAGLLADEDTRDSTHAGMRQQIVQLHAAFRSAGSFIEPEILQCGREKIEAFLAAEPRLADYRFYLEDIARRSAHTLSPAEEKLLADVAPLAASPSGIYGVLTDADFPSPTVELSDGKAVTLTSANYGLYRASANRQDRETVMSSYMNGLGGFSRTFGTTMNGSLQKARLFANARKYPSALAAALDGPNVPVAVYMRLVEGVNRHLPTLHRYLRLRRRLLGVSELHYYDLYAPLVESVDLSYSPEQAEGHILASMAPLGRAYTDVLKQAMSERWIDLYPSPGKRSGAYSDGSAYDVHPYILMNYNGKYDDMSTITHELGHTMQSYLSNQRQPYILADYPIFVAEVASTFNEALLVQHLLDTITDERVRLSLLGNYLENVKFTVFRQTKFAEFELRMHDMAQAGEAITGESLGEIYLGLTRKYYGHADGVTVVDDYIAHEWSMIPHFYHEFYVFQYATSFTASEALAEKVRSGVPGAVDRVLNFLSAGGSKYPIDLLKDAGVDMTTDEPLDLTMQAMNRVMDQIERMIGGGR